MRKEVGVGVGAGAGGPEITDCDETLTRKFDVAIEEIAIDRRSDGESLRYLSVFVSPSLIYFKGRARALNPVRCRPTDLLSRIPSERG